METQYKALVVDIRGVVSEVIEKGLKDRGVSVARSSKVITGLDRLAQLPVLPDEVSIFVLGRFFDDAPALYSHLWNVLKVYKKRHVYSFHNNLGTFAPIGADDLKIPDVSPMDAGQLALAAILLRLNQFDEDTFVDIPKTP